MLQLSLLVCRMSRYLVNHGSRMDIVDFVDFGPYPHMPGRSVCSSEMSIVQSVLEHVGNRLNYLLIQSDERVVKLCGQPS